MNPTNKQIFMLGLYMLAELLLKQWYWMQCSNIWVRFQCTLLLVLQASRALFILGFLHVITYWQRHAWLLRLQGASIRIRISLGFIFLKIWKYFKKRFGLFLFSWIGLQKDFWSPTSCYNRLSFSINIWRVWNLFHNLKPQILELYF